MAVDNRSIHRTQRMRKHYKPIPDLNSLQRNFDKIVALLTLRQGRHPLCKRLEDGGGASRGIRFQSLSAREHQHDQCSGKILVQQQRRDDRDSRE